MAIGSKINRILENTTGFKIKKYFPRPSVRFAKKHFRRPITAVEIGVFRGEHARNILQTLPIKRLYLVDPYKSNIEYDQKELTAAMNKAKPLFSKKNVTFIRKTSFEAASDVPDNIDFIYMDGDDTYEGMRRDLSLFWKKLGKGGIIAGHDFWKTPLMKDVDVVHAVTEFAVKNNLQLNVHQEDWWIVK